MSSNAALPISLLSSVTEAVAGLSSEDTVDQITKDLKRVKRKLHPSSSSSSTSGIHYAPLKEEQDEIRLITILTLTEESLVCCQLETVSLKALTPAYDAFLAGLSEVGARRTVGEWRKLHAGKAVPRFTWGDYAALSYVWGDTSISCPIILNGQEVHVGKKLEIALRALSSSSPDGCKLWVDAICINQEDFLERGRQIGKMRNIYGNAWAVVAWLGEEYEGSHKALALLQALSEVDVEGLEARLRNDPECLGVGAGAWTALEAFMNRPYWYRLWIIQEMVLGASSLALRCGDSFITWNALCEAIGVLFKQLWTAKDYLLDYEALVEGRPARVWSPTSLHLIYQDLWAISKNEDRSGTHRLSFGKLLDIANSADARDIRDKVYGLQGLMDPIINEKLSPDYHSPPARVYAAVAKAFIEIYENLEPIREGNPWGPCGTPSWAGDWMWDGRIRHRRPVTNIWGCFWTELDPPKESRPAIPYQASGSKEMNVSFSGTFGLEFLSCRGFIFDEIDGLGARGSTYFDWKTTSIVQPASGTNAYGSPAATEEALYRALVLDRVAGGEKASERHAAILSLPSSTGQAMASFHSLGWTWLSLQRGYYFRWSRWRQSNRDFDLFGKPLHKYFNPVIPDDAVEYDYTEAYSCYDRTSKGRRFITTQKGYLGWAPDNIYGRDNDQVMKGDKVAIIFGCSMPIVIRPYRDTWVVLGEAYVQGIMDGEALDCLKDGRCEVRGFALC